MDKKTLMEDLKILLVNEFGYDFVRSSSVQVESGLKLFVSGVSEYFGELITIDLTVTKDYIFVQDDVENVVGGGSYYITFDEMASDSFEFMLLKEINEYDKQFEAPHLEVISAKGQLEISVARVFDEYFDNYDFNIQNGNNIYVTTTDDYGDSLNNILIEEENISIEVYDININDLVKLTGQLKELQEELKKYLIHKSIKEAGLALQKTAGIMAQFQESQLTKDDIRLALGILKDNGPASDAVFYD